MEYYSNDMDFFGLFAANDFDKEEFSESSKVWKGYVTLDTGELVLAGEFYYDRAGGTGGRGWWDDTVM